MKRVSQDDTVLQINSETPSSQTTFNSHTENSQSSECINSKKQKLEEFESSYLYDAYHQIIPHNPQYRYFLEHDIFRIVSKYFPNLRQLKQDTPVPIPNSDQDLEMMEHVNNSDNNNSQLMNEKEKNMEKQRYTVQRRIAFLLIDQVFKQPNHCCPFCWLPINYCVCKTFIYAWRENSHLRFNDPTLNLEYSKHNKPTDSQIREMLEIVKHSEQPSPLQHSEPYLKFILLMHTKEFFRKSNTGKVLMDTLPDGFVEIYLVDVEEHERKFCEKYHLKPGDTFDDNLTFLLFPSDDAYDLDENFIKSIKEKQERLSSSLKAHSADTSQKQPRKPINLILIDSTWQQAKHVLKRLCQKEALQRAKFDQSKVVHLYEQKEPIFNSLRKQTEKDRTSTLECALLCMFLFDLYSNEFSKPLIHNLKTLVVLMHKMCHKALDLPKH